LKKNYSPSFWISVIEALCRRAAFEELEPVLLLGPAERDLLPVFQERLKATRVEISICPEKPALKLLLRQAVLFLGHDSGVTHLAGMLGTPTVALFRKKNTNQWQPLGPAVKVAVHKTASPKLIEEVLASASDLTGVTTEC
jgi:ADP-heptose:LPS heptosyltransferase